MCMYCRSDWCLLLRLQLYLLPTLEMGQLDLWEKIQQAHLLRRGGGWLSSSCIPPFRTIRSTSLCHVHTRGVHNSHHEISYLAPVTENGDLLLPNLHMCELQLC
jgi:hypothetical protein